MQVFDLLRFDAFSSIWYWIFVAAIWAHVMRAPMGISAELLSRAGRGDAQAAKDMASMAGVELRARQRPDTVVGSLPVAAWSFLITTLLVLSVGYGIESAQASLFVAVPMALVSWLSARTAQHLTKEVAPEAVYLRLTRLRMQVHGLGFVALFVTAVYGMAHNLSQAI